MKNEMKNEPMFLTIREKIGQLLMLDFRFWGNDENGKPKPFTEPSKEVCEIISSYNLGGVAFFRENCRDTEQIVKLVDSLQGAAKIPLLIGIDQEGGIVTRLQAGTDMPGNMALGATYSAKLVRKSAAVIGKELAILGINLNFAPDIDVNSNQKNPVIGVRSFGNSARFVSKMGIAYIEGLAESGTLSCVKHFPGHGNTDSDTHLGLATVNKFDKSDLLPFKRAFASKADTVMAAHVIVPALDKSKEISKKDGKKIGIPTTFSKKILTKHLRQKMGFKGVVMSDAMDMKAISDHFGKEEACIKTILAGMDLVVMPVAVKCKEDIAQLDSLIGKLAEEYQENEKFAFRVNESLNRLLTLKDNLKSGDKGLSQRKRIKSALSVVNCRKHKRLEQRIASRAITLLRNEGKTLPYKLTEKSKLFVIGYSKAALDVFCPEITNMCPKCSLSTEVISQDGALSDKISKAIKDADFTVLLTCNLNDKTLLPPKIVKFAADNKKKLAVIACRNPYDIAFLENVKAYLAVYGAPGFDQTNYIIAKFATNLRVSAGAVFIKPGREKSAVRPEGRLPVEIINPKDNSVLFKLKSGLRYK